MGTFLFSGHAAPVAKHELDEENRNVPIYLLTLYSAPQYGHFAQPVCSMGR